MLEKKKTLLALNIYVLGRVQLSDKMDSSMSTLGPFLIDMGPGRGSSVQRWSQIDLSEVFCRSLGRAKSGSEVGKKITNYYPMNNN